LLSIVALTVDIPYIYWETLVDAAVKKFTVPVTSQSPAVKEKDVTFIVVLFVIDA
jgi:hypothetical protein